MSTHALDVVAVVVTTVFDSFRWRGGGWSAIGSSLPGGFGATIVFADVAKGGDGPGPEVELGRVSDVGVGCVSEARVGRASEV